MSDAGDWEETEEDISRKWNADEAGCENDLVIKENPTDQKTRTKEKRDPVQRGNSRLGEIMKIFGFHVEFQGSRGLVISGHCQTSARTEWCPTHKNYISRVYGFAFKTLCIGVFKCVPTLRGTRNPIWLPSDIANTADITNAF